MARRRGGEYQGHKNWNYWNVSLWINNDEGLYNRTYAVCSVYGRRAAAKMLLRSLPKKTPDGAPYSEGSLYHAMEGMACKRRAR